MTPERVELAAQSCTRMARFWASCRDLGVKDSYLNSAYIEEDSVTILCVALKTVIADWPSDERLELFKAIIEKEPYPTVKPIDN